MTSRVSSAGGQLGGESGPGQGTCVGDRRRLFVGLPGVPAVTVCAAESPLGPRKPATQNKRSEGTASTTEKPNLARLRETIVRHSLLVMQRDAAGMAAATWQGRDTLRRS